MRSVVAFVASIALAASVIAATPRAARADEDDGFSGPALPAAAMPAPADAAPTRVYYGYQNLGVDAAGIGLLVLGPSSQHDGLTMVGLGVYALGSPMVHLVHGHVARAAGSFALRAGLPLVFGVATGALIGGSGSGDDIGGGVGAAVGTMALGAVGAALAVFIDDVGLSWDEKPAGPTWAPTAQASAGGGMTFGVAGTF